MAAVNEYIEHLYNSRRGYLTDINLLPAIYETSRQVILTAAQAPTVHFLDQDYSNLSSVHTCAHLVLDIPLVTP